MHKKKREVLRFLKSTLKQMENNDRFSAHEKGGHLPTGECIFNAKETQDCLHILGGLAFRLMSLCEASNAEDSNGRTAIVRVPISYQLAQKNSRECVKQLTLTILSVFWPAVCEAIEKLAQIQQKLHGADGLLITCNILDKHAIENNSTRNAKRAIEQVVKAQVFLFGNINAILWWYVLFLSTDALIYHSA